MNEIEDLKRRIAELEKTIADMQFSSSIPLNFEQAMLGRGFIKTGSTTVFTVPQGGTGATTLTGILKGNGTTAITAIAPLSGANTYYAAPSSGGSPTVGLNFNNGILVSVS